MSAEVELEDVWVRFGDFVAAEEVDIKISAGEFFSFLGPSGCGKTTLLRAISGFLEPSRGRVLIGGRDMSGIGPNRRPTALIFQNLALFPLMSVWENIAFALEVRGESRAKRRKRADELLDLIALPGQGDKKVNELSGGQRQRVAIARALAAEPNVLLLDEPLSALDLKLRQHMRTELRAIQQRVGVTFIYITHDQGEALTMSDHVAVMREGRIEQVGDGTAIYDRPETAFVASFVGENNLIRGVVSEVDSDSVTVETTLGTVLARPGQSDVARLTVGDKAFVFVRPESLRFSDSSNEPNRIFAQVDSQEFEGNLWQLYLRADAQPLRMSLVNNRRRAFDDSEPSVAVSFAPEAAVALPEGPLAAE
ncbi:MAG: ABC transporter ATP-binding protein [Pseudomonadota bacterium]